MKNTIEYSTNFWTIDINLLQTERDFSIYLDKLTRIEIDNDERRDLSRKLRKLKAKKLK